MSDKQDLRRRIETGASIAVCLVATVFTGWVLFEVFGRSAMAKASAHHDHG